MHKLLILFVLTCCGCSIPGSFNVSYTQELDNGDLVCSYKIEGKK